jgi:hypothetical protein
LREICAVLAEASLTNLMQRSEENRDLAHFIAVSTFHLQSHYIWQL